MEDKRGNECVNLHGARITRQPPTVVVIPGGSARDRSLLRTDDVEINLRVAVCVCMRKTRNDVIRHDHIPFVEKGGEGRNGPLVGRQADEAEGALAENGGATRGNDGVAFDEAIGAQRPLHGGATGIAGCVSWRGVVSH